jgi:tetratricopeptide (TPR) repeat protein
MCQSTLFFAAVALTLALACVGQRSRIASPHATQSESADDAEGRAEALAMRGRWDEARALIDRALEAARRRGDTAGEVQLLLQRGRTLSNQARHRGGDRATAFTDLQAALRKADASGDAEAIAATTDALGMDRYTRWFSSQDPAELAGADELFRKALAMRAPRGDSSALASSYFHIGLVHQMQSEYEAARRAFERALEMSERLNDERILWDAARQLGYLAELRRDWVASEALYRRSLEVRERLGSGPGVAAALVALAELRYMRDGNAVEALGMLTRARDTAASTGSLAYVAISSAAIGRVHRDRGQYDEALRWFAAALAVADEMQSNEDVPQNYDHVALVHLLRGDAAAAVVAGERGLARRSTPRLQAVVALARARAGQGAAPPALDAKDPVVSARLALATGDAAGALAAAVQGDDPDTLLLAARAVGPSGFDRASAAARAMSRAQGLRFAREAGRLGR